MSVIVPAMATNRFLIVISILLDDVYLAVSVDVTVTEQGGGNLFWPPCPMAAVTCVKPAEEGSPQSVRRTEMDAPPESDSHAKRYGEQTIGAVPSSNRR